MAINNKSAEAKYNVSIPVTGALGVLANGISETIPCHAETQLRIEVTGVGPTNAIQIYGRLRSSELWHYIATVTGPVTGLCDISTYDFIRYFHTVADGTGTLAASGFILNTGSEAVLSTMVGTNTLLQPALRTMSEVTGSITPSGLHVRMKISNITVTDVAAQVPAAALTARNSIIIENRDAVNSIFIGESTVTATGANQGWEMAATSIFSTDVLIR